MDFITAYRHEFRLACLMRRIQYALSLPPAVREQQAVISKTPDEWQVHWDAILDELTDTEGLTVTRLTKAQALVVWHAHGSELEDNLYFILNNQYITY